MENLAQQVRELPNLTEFARRSGISLRTLTRVRGGENLSPLTRKVLETELVKFKRRKQ